MAGPEDTIIAGSAHIKSELEKKGADFVSGEDLYGHEKAISANSRIVGILKNVRGQVRNSLPDQLCETAISILAVRLMLYFANEAMSEQLSGKLIYLTDGKSYDLPPPEVTAVLADELGCEDEEVLSSTLKPGHVFFKKYELDLRTISGKKLESAHSEIPRVFFNFSKEKQSRNLTKLFFTRWIKRKNAYALRYHLRVPVKPIPDKNNVEALSFTADDTLNEFIRENLQSTIRDYFSYRDAMVRFLNRHGTPVRAVFNHVQNTERAAFASVLNEAGVECEMYSHGCLVPHGRSPRREIVKCLADAQYNGSPSLTKLRPRSPLQVYQHSPAQKIEKKQRVVSFSKAKATSASAKTIYFAPNYITWHKGFHGISANCFETVVVTEKLASAIASIPSVNLLVRIKTTAKDVAEANKGAEGRGLYPKDVAYLLDPENGVLDASSGSHSEYLVQSDLVITEGVTAVMFEALEARKPVLLVVRSRSLDASLPGWSAETLLSSDGRNAVYCASLEDDLPAVLASILQRHNNKPLRNEELQPYVWV